jgi:2-octaprenyl-6-methoxyphenol hydroxylase
MMAAPSCDVAIVGGGMAGASLALLLAKHAPRLNIKLLESMSLQQGNTTTLPSYDDRSSALSLGSCRIFQSLSESRDPSTGLWEKLLPHLEAITQVHVSDRGHPAGTVLDAQQMAALNGVLGYVVENRNLGAVLLGAVRNSPAIELQDSTTVESISPRAEQVLLTLQDGQTLSCSLLVIADGADSRLREQLGIPVDRKPYRQAAVIANVTTSAFHEHVAYDRFTDSGPMALLPLQDFAGDHRCALVWTIEEDFSEAVSQMTDAQFLQHIQQRFGNRLGFFTKTGKRHVYPLTLIKAQEQIRSRIVLMGNAAHSMHPVAGQGFNLSLRDCLALAQTLAMATQQQEDIGKLAVLQRYLQRQQQDQDQTIDTSHLLTLLFSSDETPLALARNTGLLGLNFLPGLKQWFARHAMGVAGQHATNAGITKK